jgi:O-antigen/teichoic acid export membrane protein
VSISTENMPATAAPPPSFSDPEGADIDFRSRVLSGFAWGMVTSVGSQLSKTVVAVVLARLLTPHDYGLANMAIVFSSLVLVFSDLSLGGALVQRPRITEADKSTVFWTGLFVGFALTAAGVAASGLVAGFFHEPAVQPLFAVVSLSFVFSSLQMAQVSVLHREMRFRLLNLRVLASVVVSGMVGLAAALAGLGAWALVLQQVTLGVVSTGLLWVYSDWRPRFVFSLSSLRDLGGFGANVLGARTIDYLNRNADNLLVGRFLGSAALGAYAVAYNIMLLPLTRLILPIQDALFPAYARWQHDRERLASVWLRVDRVVAALVAPAMLGVAVVAPDFVDVVLGERWHAAVPVLQVLAVVALLQSIASLGERVLQALDRTGTIFRFSVVELLVTLPAFAVGLVWGIVGVAICYGAVNVVLRPAYVFVTTKALGISFWTLPRGLVGVAQASVVMTAAVWAARAALVAEGVPPALRLAVCVALGAVVYTPIALWRIPELRRELGQVRRARSRRSPQAASAETPAET